MISQCAWCSRLLEDIAASQAPTRQITHGICSQCYQVQLAALDSREGISTGHVPAQIVWSTAQVAVLEPT